VEVVGERGEDFVGGLGPGEGPWVGVPGIDPGADVAFEGVDAGVDAAAQELVGEQAEPAFDLVDPGGAGRGEVDVEARVAAQPGLDLGGVVGTSLVKSIFVWGCRVGSGGSGK
jgi:hypothetical protein